MIDNEAVNRAVCSALAADILQRISPEHRDAMVAGALAKSLDSYRMSTRLEEVAAEIAVERARVICREDGWTARIDAAVRAGFEVYLANLTSAVPRALTEMMHGKESISVYDRKSGSILTDRVWPRKEPA